MPLYFLRHGQSQANINGLFAGQKENSPLTDLGKQQAQAAGEALQNANIGKIVSSPLKRTQETAAIVAKSLGITNITTDDRLMEYDMGELTGTPNKAVSSRELISAKGAENPDAFQHRVVAALREYSQADEAILLVSHAGVGRVIEASKQGVEAGSFYDIPSYPNAQAVILDLSWLKNATL
jgi:broad specificity phosphatase PhoE